jgi:hypothetical protein
MPYYKTGYEATPSTAQLADTPLVGYTGSGANLVGQNGQTDLAGNGSFTVISSTGVPGVTAGQGAQVVKSTALNTAGTTGYTDVYSTDTVLSSSTVMNSPTTGSPAGMGGVVNVTFDMSRTGGAGKSTGFGVEILSKNQDAVLASLFLGNNATDNTPEVLVAKNGDNYAPNTAAGYGRNDGVWGTYNISLDFNAGTFTVFVAGNVAATGPFAMDAAALAEGNAIGGIALANTNNGTDVAYFDNLQVVPEPTGVAMVGLGTLLLLAKRPKRTA